MKVRNLLILFSNLFPAFVVFAAICVRFSLIRHAAGVGVISQIILICQLLFVAVFFIIRRRPTQVSYRPIEVVMAFFATFAPSLFDGLSGYGRSQFFGIFLQIAGNLLAVFALISLGRSFGILPAYRGVQTHGLYRVVRHPLYASYLVANLGYIWNHPSLYNFTVVLVCLLSQISRIYAEERLLATDRRYAAYQKQVRWRLVPFVF